MADDETGLVQLANSLLDQLHISTKITSLDELSSMVFALMYEGLCGEHLKDLIRRPKTQQDEVHNCQLVIDALSMDILHTSLSHITGEDVAMGDHIAVSNLLELFSGLMEYILNKIESDLSSSDGDRGLELEDDPDVVDSDVIIDALQKEFSKPSAVTSDDQNRHSTRQRYDRRLDIEREKTRKQHDQFKANQSKEKLHSAPGSWEVATSSFSGGPGRSNKHRTDGKYRDNMVDKHGSSGGLETTDSLIREGELLEQQMRKVPETDQTTNGLGATPELTPPQRLSQDEGVFDQVGVRPRPENGPAMKDNQPGRGAHSTVDPTHHTYTHHLYHHYQGHISLPEQSRHQNNYQKAAVPVSSYQVTDTRSQPTDSLQPVGLIPSVSQTEPPQQYGNLDAVVEETLEMSRRAVSPVRGHPRQDNLLPDDICRRLARIETESAEINHLAASLNIPQGDRPVANSQPLSKSVGAPPSTAKQTTPVGGPRKVSFRVDNDKCAQKDIIRAPDKSQPDSPVKSSLRRYYEERSRRKRQTNTASPLISTRPQNLSGYGSEGDIDDLLEELSSPDASPDRLHPYGSRFCDLMLKDLVIEDNDRKEVHRPPRKAGVSTHNRHKGSVEAVKDTQKHVEAEDRKAKRKTEYLRLLYEHELQDLKDELRSQQEDNKAKSTEMEYKKKVLGSKPKIKSGKKSVDARPSRTGARLAKTKPKQRRRSASASPTVGRKAISSVEEENNLFSMLHDEFPYLYLSSETWHELWRQGIQQIERLTRAQQAVKTRKSRATAQLEEAQDRQKILLNIMKKELSHSQRMRELKMKRDQEISLKNKLHEKRMQSARCRKYYNEYQVRSRAKMLKRRTKEEMIFKKLFKDGLEIQKERIKELRRYAKEQREIQAKQRQNDIDSLENYYRDQFEMLADSVAREREEQRTREKAQAKVLDQMKKELRKKMEREIEDFQEQLFRDDDDVYFRQLDADRLKEELRVAKYNVRV